MMNTVKLKDGTKVPEFIICKNCGSHLHISPNSKGAFSYQGCNCHEPEWFQTTSPAHSPDSESSAS